jgi:hypothetical protein
MRRLLIAAAALLALPATADAAPTSVHGPEGIAIAASGDRVVWVENTFENDELVIRMRGAGGGARLGTVKLPDATDGEVTASIAANGLGYLVVLVTGQADMVLRGAWGGALQTVLDCRGAELPNPPRVAAGSQGFAFAGPRCAGGGKAVETVGMTGDAVPVAGLTVPERYALAYAEPFVATVGNGLDVVDLRSGARRHVDAAGIADGGSQLGLLADGTAITGSLGGGDVADDDVPVVPEGVYAWALGAERPQLLAARGYIGGLVAGGRSVLVESERGLEVMGVDERGARKIGAPGLGSADTPLSFDGRVAAFRDTTCFGKDETTWLDVNEPPRPGTENGCPLSMYTGALRFGPSGRTTLAVRCRNGCNADLRWLAQGPTKFCRIPPTDIPNPFPGKTCKDVATGKLRLRPSRRTQHIAVQLTAEGRRARREGFHRIPVNDTELGSLGLEYHRLVSRLIFL